ncbi:hypothetical protein [Lyticum sinuosum]|uniref:Uncharacterized protein n=1 Tax=Lyticum sinuosum TaxID=1332059 RepID=A0AAE4VKL3_9RICK|nr:hypothetical protein [Lyticum sinuosum]MDZ5761577.1 hypothetical protein [Lyticum sinuosum]
MKSNIQQIFSLLKEEFQDQQDSRSFISDPDQILMSEEPINQYKTKILAAFHNDEYDDMFNDIEEIQNLVFSGASNYRSIQINKLVEEMQENIEIKRQQKINEIEDNNPLKDLKILFNKTKQLLYNFFLNINLLERINRIFECNCNSLQKKLLIEKGSFSGENSHISLVSNDLIGNKNQSNIKV